MRRSLTLDRVAARSTKNHDAQRLFPQGKHVANGSANDYFWRGNHGKHS
jgi:hypothetical protein